MQRTLPLQDKGFKTISDEQPTVPSVPMENQHAPALLASTENLVEDLTDDEVSFSTDQNIFSFVQEMAKGKVIIYIYIYIYMIYTPNCNKVVIKKSKKQIAKSQKLNRN